MNTKFLLAAVASFLVAVQARAVEEAFCKEGETCSDDTFRIVFSTTNTSELPQVAVGEEILDTADPISLLNYLFRAGPPLPAPFRRCESDPGGDALGCEQPNCV